MTTYSCPKCKADLTGEPIPERSRHLFGNSTHFSKVIGNIVTDRHSHWISSV